MGYLEETPLQNLYPLCTAILATSMKTLYLSRFHKYLRVHSNFLAYRLYLKVSSTFTYQISQKLVINEYMTEGTEKTHTPLLSHNNPKITKLKTKLMLRVSYLLTP